MNAELAECSAATVQAIELGKLKLSEKLALTITGRTGVDMMWLMRNNTNRPIIAEDQTPYTKETYERARSKDPLHLDRSSRDPIQAYRNALVFYAIICDTLLAAMHKNELPLAMYRINAGLREAGEAFGLYGDFFGDMLRLIKKNCSGALPAPEVPAQIHKEFSQRLFKEMGRRRDKMSQGEPTRGAATHDKVRKSARK